MNQTSGHSKLVKESKRRAAKRELFPRTAELGSQSALFWVTNKSRFLRQLLIRDIQRITGRPLCVYFASSEITAKITQQDAGRLYEVVSMFDGKPFDLLLETGGGDTDATEGLTSMLRDLSPKFRVIVPNRAKSNGTLICLAADEILMGVTSELGPIEPHFQGIPVSLLLKRLNDKDVWPIPEQAQFALDHTKKIAKALLKTGMMHDKQEHIESTVDFLCDRTTYPSHGSVIDATEAERLHLKVQILRPENDLWRKVWLLYCMYVFDAKETNFSKIFEQETFSHPVIGPDPIEPDEIEGGLLNGNGS